MQHGCLNLDRLSQPQGTFGKHLHPLTTQEAQAADSGAAPANYESDGEADGGLPTSYTQHLSAPIRSIRSPGRSPAFAALYVPPPRLEPGGGAGGEDALKASLARQAADCLAAQVK